MSETLLAYSYTAVTIALLYFFLKKSVHFQNSLRKSILWWVLFGFIFNFYSFTWLYTVYPLIWMPAGVIQIIGIFVLHFILSVTASIGFSTVGVLTRLKSKEGFKPFIFAISLVIAEMIRSLLVSLIFKGEGSTITFHYTSSTIGNALATTPFVEFAFFGGTFALTFILGYLVYIFLMKETLMLYWKHGATITVVLIIVHVFIPTYGPTAPVTVGVVTTNFGTRPDKELTSSFQKQNKQLHEMTLSFASSSPMIIVYPEDARYIEYTTESDKESLLKLFPKTLFIDGNTNIYKGKMVNVSSFYSPGTKTSPARGKSFLLPFNEFIPLFFRPIFSLFIPKEDMDTYTRNHTYAPIQSKKTIVFNGVRLGTLLCSEILSHATIQSVRKEKPSLVFFQSHLNVFNNNPWAWAMLYSSTKVAAAQLRSPLISSVNGAPSFIVSPYGRIIKTLPTGFSTSTYIFSR